MTYFSGGRAEVKGEVRGGCGDKFGDVDLGVERRGSELRRWWGLGDLAIPVKFGSGSDILPFAGAMGIVDDTGSSKCLVVSSH